MRAFFRRIRYRWLVARHGEAWARAWITLENFERKYCRPLERVNRD